MATVKKVLKVSKSEKRNITWNVNQALIQDAYIKFVTDTKGKHRCPTLVELSKATGLSRQCITKHASSIKFQPKKSYLRALTPDVISAIYSAAQKNNAASQKLWFQIMEGWSEKTETKANLNVNLNTRVEYILPSGKIVAM